MMSESPEKKSAGWKIVQSICMELDAALTFAGGNYFAAGTTPELIPLRQANSDDWLKEWDIYYGDMNWFCSVLETASILAGVLEEADYSRATMTIRQTTIESAILNLEKQAALYDMQSNENLPPEDSLIDLFVRYRKYAYESIGFAHPGDPMYESRLKKEIRFCLEIFRGGRHHDPYWHWLDHFYYQVYHPWRESRRNFMVDLEKKLITVLGSAKATDRIPDLNWLPSLNPALRYPEIGRAIRSARLPLNFWLEPFGFSDTFSLLPGQVYLSFAEPGKIYESFAEYSRLLSARVQALADPTRLIILRLIRAFSMTNTDMAAYLGISRPTVSIHARILREAGLINSREEGRITRHEINSEAVKKLFHDLSVYLDLPFDPPED